LFRTRKKTSYFYTVFYKVYVINIKIYYVSKPENTASTITTVIVISTFLKRYSKA